MPKLHGFQELFDDYDCIITRNVSATIPNRITLFGSLNAGNSVLTNRVPDVKEFDRKITHWYMRTNLRESPELTRWLDSTNVTLTIGDKKTWSANLLFLSTAAKEGVHESLWLNYPPRQQMRVIVDLNVADTKALIASIPEDFVGDNDFWKETFVGHPVDYSQYRASDFVGAWIHVCGRTDIPV